MSHYVNLLQNILICYNSFKKDELYMIVLIAGTSHTGKTNLAQKLLETYHYPYMSLDY